MFTNQQVYGQLALGLACILIPLASMVYLKVKKQGLIRYALYGALVFFFFALTLERFLHGMVLPQIDIQTQPWIYALYGALAAAVFEEIPRYFVLKGLDKKDKVTLVDSLQYGLGHGGFEMMILVGISCISNFLLEKKINEVGLNGILKGLPLPYQGQVKVSVEALKAFQGTDYFLPLIERLLSLSFHITMGVFAFFLLRGILKKSGLFWMVFLHFIVDLPAGLYQAGKIKSLGPVYGVYLVLILVLAYFLRSQWKKAILTRDQEEQGGI